MSGPYLLYVVGATKSGTSWLYRTFYTHPDCKVRSVKELHYWDTTEDKQRRSQVGSFRRKIAEYEARIVTAEAEGDARKVENTRRMMRETEELIGVIEGDRAGHSAYLDFVYHNAGPRKVLAADITPSYAALPVETLAEMAALRGDSRFLYILRDPLQRFWSHVRMVAAWRSKSREDAPDFEIAANALALEVLEKGAEPIVLDRGDYRGALTRLSAAVPAERLHIIFAEDMLTQPGFDALSDTLGLTRKGVPVGTRVHASRPADMQPDIADRVMERLREQYDWAAGTLGPLPESWQANMTRIAA